MRKTLIVAGVLAGCLVVQHAARAESLSDIIAAMFGWSVDDGGASPNDGPGTGTGVAD